MRETGGYPRELAVRSRQVFADPVAEGLRIAAEVHGDIEHDAGRHPHQLALRFSDLVMQAAQHVLRRAAVVVLDELGRQAVGGEIFGVEGFHEKTAAVFEHRRL